MADLDATESVVAEDDEAQEPKFSPGLLVWTLVRELLEAVVPALVLALLLTHFVAQTTYVYGYSMEPSLHSDQRLLVEKVSYRFHGPRRGDIVVVDVPSSRVPLIKRVIGLSGETIAIRDSRVLIDGVPLAESYLTNTRQGNYGPTEIPAGHVFVMGDNRGASNDSRSFGPVPVDRVVGRAWVSYWPVEEWGFVD